MLQKFLFRSFCCCICLKKGCMAIGALEWIYTIYLSCRYHDMERVGCRGLKLSCNQIYYNVISFVVSAAIISGIKKNSNAYFIPWLICKFIEYTVFTSIMIYDLQSRYTFAGDIAMPMSLTIISIFMFYYSWLCVLSLYFNMGFEEKQVDQNNPQLQEMV